MKLHCVLNDSQLNNSENEKLIFSLCTLRSLKPKRAKLTAHIICAINLF